MTLPDLANYFDVPPLMFLACPSPGCPERLTADGEILRCPSHGPMLMNEDLQRELGDWLA